MNNKNNKNKFVLTHIHIFYLALKFWLTKMDLLIKIVLKSK